MEKQIRVTLGTTTTRKTVIANANETVKSVLEANNVNYGTATMHLDGCPMNVSDLSSTFEELGVKDTAYLLAVVKTNNA